MTIEMQAEMLLEAIKDALKSKEVPRRQDAKEQIRLMFDSDYKYEYQQSEIQDFMAECYFGAAVQSRMGAILFTEDGAELGGIHLSWANLADCVHQCLTAGTYMTVKEERDYQDFANVAREIVAERLEQYLTENTQESKIQAALHCGKEAWKALAGDPDELVRGVVAMVADEEIQMQLVNDQSPNVRLTLAGSGTDRVQLALLAKEKDTKILKEIVENGSLEVQAAVIEQFWDDSATLRAICSSKLCSEAKRVLLESSDPHVALLGIEEASKEQCQRLAQTADLTFTERMNLEWRLEAFPEEGPVIQ